ncbi:snRNA-activating protein complex subunit 4 isoform X3 [Monodelphis domestica]|uniref:snRNA-activating protein complex subunit 4 isoform X3 n=1 Tax=Monodelphis domestica TaxID=13616 RepID=UPI0004430FB6|nr:snRNA-activating protein complex subunit 4 isoform X3 [Monodelphis domestica]
MSDMDLVAEREKITKQIKNLEKILDPNIATIEVVVSDSNLDSTSEADSLEDDDWDEHIPMEEESWGESDEDDSKDQALPKDPETCLQLNMVYQEVLQEKIAEIDLLLAQNKEQQEEVMWDLAGSKASKTKDGKSLPSNVFVGHFMKPYFKDKVTGIGPPANEDTREKATQGIKSFEELIVTKWKTWEKTLLRKSVISDHLQRLLQPKLLKLEYLNQKLDKVSDSVEKQILEKQIKNTEKEIEDINQLPEESLLGDRLDERDWEKISNINFEGSRSADEIRKFWQNCEHPSINKQAWVEEETKRLKEIAAKHNYLEWQKIAAELGTNRSAFQCLQMYQQYNKDLKRKEWTKEEDHMLTQLVEEMRVGNHIPYRKIVYYMEGRDSMQLIYRWTKSLNPNLKKGFWTPEEDAKLLQAVAKYGERDWFKIREEVPGRSDAQCRDRYLRRLHFSLKKGRWNAKEEEKLIELIEKYGAGHWAKIASELPHRTGSQCLSKWKALIRKKKRPRKRQKSRKKCSSCSSSSSSSSSSEDAQLEWHNDLEKEKDAEGALDEHQYTVPSIDLWMPTRHSHSEPCKDPGWCYSRPSTISPCLSKASGPSKDGSQAIPSVAVAKRRDFSQDKDILTPTMDMECTTLSADIGLEKPQEELEEASKTGKRILKVPLNDVKKVIRINTCLEYQKLKERLKKTHLFTSSLASKIDNGMAIEKVVQVWHKTFLNRQRQQKVGIQRKRLDRKLLMAVTPWVGDIVIPCWSSRKAVTVQTRAEAIMTKLQTIHLTSTPVFTLFIQLLQIDTDGCMKVIGERKTKQSELLWAITGNPQRPQQASSSLQKTSGCLMMKGVSKETQKKSISKMKDLPESTQPGPTVLPTSFGPISKPKTVSELLREKRLRESRARKALESTVILAPQVLITPPVILQQSLQPLIPSTLAMTQPLGSGSAGKPVAVASSPVATFQTPSPIIASTKSPEKSSNTNNSGSSQGNEVIAKEKVNETEGTSAPQVGALISGQSSSMRSEGHSVPSESPVPAIAANPVPGISQISTSSGPANLLSSQATTASKKQELPNAPVLAPSQVSMQQPKPISLVPALSVPTCGPQVISSNMFPITWVVTTQGLVPMSMSTFVGLPGPGKPAGTPVLPIVGGVARNQSTLKLLPSSIVKQSFRAPQPSPTLAKRPLIASKTLTGELPSGIAGPNLPIQLPTTASLNTGNHSGKNSLPEDQPSSREVKTAREMSAPLSQPETQPQTKSPTNQPRTEPDGCDCAPTPEVENPTGVTIGGPDPMQKSLLLETKDHLPAQNGNPGKSFPISTEIPKPITQQQEGLAAQDSQPKAMEPGKSILDLNLLSLENEASIREWLKGKQGVCLPPLQSTLPYLPPFLCNLKTLSGLLLQKKSLEQKAVTIVAQGSIQDKNDVSREDVQSARHLVQQQLKENPAYLLLKARFLAAFALPAFLATLPPPRVPTTLSQILDRNSGSEEEKEEEEYSQSKTRPKDRDCGEKEQLVSTAGDTQSTPETVASIQVSPHPDPHAMSSALDAADFNVLKTRNAIHARKRRRV